MPINVNDLQTRNTVQGMHNTDSGFDVAFVIVSDDSSSLANADIATVIANYILSVYPGASINKTHVEPTATSL